MPEDRHTAPLPGRSTRIVPLVADLPRLMGKGPLSLDPPAARGRGHAGIAGARLAGPGIPTPGLAGPGVTAPAATALGWRRARLARRRDRVRTAVAFGVVAGGGVVLRSVALYDTPTSRAEEAALVTQVVDLAGSGAAAAAELPGRIGALAAPQLAALVSLGGGWNRAPNALGALREVSLLAWLTVAVLCWLLARRLGVSLPWALAGVAVLGLSPTAIEVSRLVVPENLAACWGLAALVVAAGPTKVGRAQFRTDLAIAGCLAVGALTAPLAVTIAPAVLVVAARLGDLRRVALLGLICLPGMATAVAAAAGTSRDVAAAGSAPGGSAVSGDGPTSWLAAGWLGHDLVTPAVAVTVAVGALGAASNRALGVALITVVAGVASTGLPAGAGYAFVVPLAAVGVAAVGHRLPTPDVRRWPTGLAVTASLVPAAVLLPAATTLVLVLGWSGNLLALPGATAPPPAEWARGWLLGNVAAGERVMTDDVLHVALTAGGVSWDRVATPASCARRARLSAVPMPASRCTDADWWVLTGSSVGPAAGPPSGAPADGPGPLSSATLVARFGGDGSPDRIEVWSTRWPVSDPAREARARQTAGRLLVVSPRLETTPELADRLRAGALDSRAATALAALLTEQPLRVVGLPEVPGEQAIGRPLRQLLLAPGRRGTVADRSPANTEQRIVDFFIAQLAPFRPYSMAITPAGVFVRYAPQGPPGLLDSLLTR